MGVDDISPDLLTELSTAVPCDRRTLRKALVGGKVSRLRFIAIERVLAARGLLGLLPQQRAAATFRSAFPVARPIPTVLTSPTGDNNGEQPAGKPSIEGQRP